MKVKQAVRAIKDGAGRIRIITVTILTIVMLCGPINIAPFSCPDFLAFDLYENSISNDRASCTAPVIIWGINELNIVIIRRAIDEIEG